MEAHPLTAPNRTHGVVCTNTVCAHVHRPTATPIADRALLRPPPSRQVFAAREEKQLARKAVAEGRLDEIHDNVERYGRMKEIEREQRRVVMKADDDRIAALIEQKRQLKESRIKGSHESAIRRQAVKESINTMKSTQNFKGLKKLMKRCACYYYYCSTYATPIG